MAELTLLYAHDQGIGYGRMGVKTHAALTALGVDVYDHLDGDCPPDRRGKLTNAVCWMSTPTHTTGWFDKQHRSILTMWEATHLPESFRENLHEFDLVMVPSQQNVELFSRYHDNVQLVLLGVDPNEWYYQERTDPGVFFDFLIGGSGDRKGLDLAGDAFIAAFPGDKWDGPIPRLTFKSPRGTKGIPRIFKDGDLVGEPRPWIDHPRIRVCSGRLTPQDERALYASSHVYLQPSRGEGFGLQPLQAMAQGMPTILTGAHGHASFAHLGYPLDSTLVPSAYFIYGQSEDWWEPDFDQLVDLMRHVYNNWDSAKHKGLEAAKVVCRHFTWRNTAERIHTLLADEMNEPYKGSADWVETTRKKYPLEVARNWNPDIAGIPYVFVPGTLYWVPADVKRLAFERGLVANTDSHDDGLTDDEIARKDFTDNLYCPHCKQRFGTGETKASRELARIGVG